jgi:prepilin-type N-terminal cleavage/methylation domain-containing protein
MNNLRNSRAGLTLIEMIATIAILATFMTLLSFHLVALSNLWLNRSDDDFFEQHVDGVTLFLGNAFAASGSATAGSSEGSGARATPTAQSGSSQPVAWARPPGFSEFDDPLLFFSSEEAPALFVKEGDPLPSIQAYLHFSDREGLSILWYSAFDAEEIEQTQDLRRTALSPYVSKIEYAYYDFEEDEWELTEDPIEEDDDSFRLPDFLQLTFAHPVEGERVRTLLVPAQSLEVPLF